MRLADFRPLLAWGLLALAGPALAGLLNGEPEGGYPENPTPTAPAFDVAKAIPIALSASSSIAMGIDPATITVESDGIVRYVAIARSTAGNAVTATYEGIRCATAEVKVYARHYPDSGWRDVTEPKWQSLYDNGPMRYSMPIAKAGICRDASSGGSAAQIVLNLRNDLLRLNP